ncbi:hypothetical protein ACHAW6_001065 [Cyclotella cf. meneghiniana]
MMAVTKFLSYHHCRSSITAYNKTSRPVGHSTMMHRIILFVLLVLSSCDSSPTPLLQRSLSDSSSSSSSSGGWSFWGFLLQLIHHCPPGQHYKSGQCKKPSPPHHHHHSGGGGGGGGGGNYTNYTNYTTYYVDKWGADGWSDDAWGSDGHVAYASTQEQNGSGTAVWPFALGALLACIVGAAFVVFLRRNSAHIESERNTHPTFDSSVAQTNKVALNVDFDNEDPNFIELPDAKNPYQSPQNVVANII